MDELIIFEIYKKLNEKESQKDKENFDESKKYLLAGLLYKSCNEESLTKDDISQKDILIKKELYPNELKRKIIILQ